MAHKCPSWCHKCPELGGEVMPGCMGTAAMARNPYDLDSCTCHHPSDESRIEKLERRVKALGRMVKQLRQTPGRKER